MLRSETRTNARAIMRLYVAGSGGASSPDKYGEPFGFLRIAAYPSSSSSVQMVLLPYNYPRLVDLLEEVRLTNKNPPPAQTRQELDAYLRSVPSYYLKALRVALKNARPPLPVERNEPSVPASIQSSLKKYRQIVEEANALAQAAHGQQTKFRQDDPKDPKKKSTQHDIRNSQLIGAPALPESPSVRSLIFSSSPTPTLHGLSPMEPTVPTPPSSPLTGPATPSLLDADAGGYLLLERDDKEPSPFGERRQPMMVRSFFAEGFALSGRDYRQPYLIGGTGQDIMVFHILRPDGGRGEDSGQVRALHIGCQTENSLERWLCAILHHNADQKRSTYSLFARHRIRGVCVVIKNVWGTPRE